MGSGLVTASACVAVALDPAIVFAERIVSVKVQIDVRRCHGHGRCHDLASGLFGDDEEVTGRRWATASCRGRRKTTSSGRRSTA
jgi:hypothetical protein